jgi:hypothetical protein
MTVLLDFLITAISLVFLGILGTIAAVAIPGLFLVAAAPWLDWIMPARKAGPDRTSAEDVRAARRG